MKNEEPMVRQSLGVVLHSQYFRYALADSEVQAYRNDVVRLPISQII